MTVKINSVAEYQKIPKSDLSAITLKVLAKIRSVLRDAFEAGNLEGEMKWEEMTIDDDKICAHGRDRRVFCVQFWDGKRSDNKRSAFCPLNGYIFTDLDKNATDNKISISISKNLVDALPPDKLLNVLDSEFIKEDIDIQELSYSQTKALATSYGMQSNAKKDKTKVEIACWFVVLSVIGLLGGIIAIGLGLIMGNWDVNGPIAAWCFGGSLVLFILFAIPTSLSDMSCSIDEKVQKKSDQPTDPDGDLVSDHTPLKGKY